LLNSVASILREAQAQAEDAVQVQQGQDQEENQATKEGEEEDDELIKDGDGPRTPPHSESPVARLMRGPGYLELGGSEHSNAAQQSARRRSRL
jgi:hypothetical protein